MPKYVWGTISKSLSLDAGDIVSTALDEWYEEAFEFVDNDSLAKLQTALNVFCKECGVGKCYEVDYKACIILEGD